MTADGIQICSYLRTARLVKFSADNSGCYRMPSRLPCLRLLRTNPSCKGGTDDVRGHGLEEDDNEENGSRTRRKCQLNMSHQTL